MTETEKAALVERCLSGRACAICDRLRYRFDEPRGYLCHDQGIQPEGATYVHLIKYPGAEVCPDFRCSVGDEASLRRWNSNALGKP